MHSTNECQKELSAYIIPHLEVSFLTICISSGRYFAVFHVILITPTAPVVIYTEYGLKLTLRLNLHSFVPKSLHDISTIFLLFHKCKKEMISQ